MRRLRDLWLEHNPSLKGELPRGLMNAADLESLDFAHTQICEPPDLAFQWWLFNLWRRDALFGSSGIKCKGPASSFGVGLFGGTFSSPDGTTYTFGPGTFPATTGLATTGVVTVTHTPLDGPPAGALAAGIQVGIRHYYQVEAVNAQGQPVQPIKPYTVTITYSDWDLVVSRADESSLALHRWDSGWVREPTSRVNAEANTVTANPSRFSTWAVLGETNLRVYLPLMIRR